MRICVAQIRPYKGDVFKNIDLHLRFMEKAAELRSDLVVFPELSLSSYEPALANDLATTPNDPQFDELQQLCNQLQLTTAAGMPLKSAIGIHIGMLIFRPYAQRMAYIKQYLHKDEMPFFVAGDSQLFLELNAHKIAPAICYEALLPQHALNAFEEGATLYMASVAKDAKGVSKARDYFPALAKKYQTYVVMANCIGPADTFTSAGNSGIWNPDGRLVSGLNNTDEGILVLDTETGEIIVQSNL